MKPIFEDVDGKPIVAIHFMDANGNCWTTGTFMAAEKGAAPSNDQHGTT